MPAKSPRLPKKAPSKAASTAEKTPLARALRQPKPRATPLDVLALATDKFMRGERLDIGQLAGELGVARATVFRWVGSREQLYAEVLSQAYARQRAFLLKTTSGTGIKRLVNVVRKELNTLATDKALRTFIAQDPEYAIRVLTSDSSSVQARTIALEKAFLREIIEEADLRPLLDLDTLAFVIVRIGESVLYGAISGRTPQIEKAVAAIRLLVVAQAPRRGVTAARVSAARTPKSR